MPGFWRGLAGLQTIISVESSYGLPHCIHGVFGLGWKGFNSNLVGAGGTLVANFGAVWAPAKEGGREKSCLFIKPSIQDDEDSFALTSP